MDELNEFVAKANGLPWWVKAIAAVGFPMVVAGYLLWQVGARIEHEHQDFRTGFSTQIKLLRIICRNTAKSVEMQVECERGAEVAKGGA